jgi:hypothetical protein
LQPQYDPVVAALLVDGLDQLHDQALTVGPGGRGHVVHGAVLAIAPSHVGHEGRPLVGGAVDEHVGVAGGRPAVTGQDTDGRLVLPVSVEIDVVDVGHDEEPSTGAERVVGALRIGEAATDDGDRRCHGCGVGAIGWSAVEVVREVAKVDDGETATGDRGRRGTDGRRCRLPGRVRLVGGGRVVAATCDDSDDGQPRDGDRTTATRTPGHPPRVLPVNERQRIRRSASKYTPRSSATGGTGSNCRR